MHSGIKKKMAAVGALYKKLPTKSSFWTKFIESTITVRWGDSHYDEEWFHYLVYLLDIAYYTGISPGRICRDGQPGMKYVWKHPGKFRKIFCVLWHVLLLLNIFTDLKQASEDHQDGIPHAIAWIYRFTYISYLLFIVSFLATLWTQMSSLVLVLNESICVQLKAQMHIKNCNQAKRLLSSVPSRVTELLMKIGIVIFIIILWGFINNTAETGKNVWTQLLFENTGFRGLFSQSGRFVISLVQNPFGPIRATQMTALALSSTYGTPNPRSHLQDGGNNFSPFFIELLGVFHTAVDVTNSCGWISADIFTILWSIHFRNMFRVILWERTAMDPPHINLKTITLFIKAMNLIERFNKATGFLILMCIISETLYISTQTAVLITGKSTLKSIVVSFFTFLPFVTVLLTSSNINYEAREFSYIFKEEFVGYSYNSYFDTPLGQVLVAPSVANIEAKGGTTNEATGKFLYNEKYSKEKINRGLMIIYHELSSNAIGLQGYFFTITYGFVGTVVSGIFTYTVVALQLVSSNQ